MDGRVLGSLDLCCSVPLSINALFTPSLPLLPLSPQAGDVLNLLERISGDWYSGENTRTGDFGDFPASSVRVIEPLP
jgi:hypothetical protein